MNKKANSTNKTIDEHEAEHAIKNYTRVPNMLVDGYKDLHPQDKWLYVCLVRLCGKEGTRYLSMRYIAERTGFSPSVLSDDKKRGKPGMIRRLHNAGLIHAEIKRRIGSDGKEEKNAQYHITVTDTWKLNHDFFYSSGDETCSKSEQDSETCSELEQVCLYPVLIPNETCSKSEQDEGEPVLNQNKTCSDSGTIVILQDKITDSSKITEVSNSASNESTSSTFVADATIPSVSSSEKLEQDFSHIANEATNESENTESGTTRNNQSSEQNHLFDANPSVPVMPPETAKWCAETLVQIVEFKRHKRFLEEARGKSQKSQRERQLDAAKKIIDAKITREEFIRAYDTRNDAWWQENRGDLTVVDMAAKTTKNVMRTLEVLESIDSKKGTKPAAPQQPSQYNSILTQEEKDFRKWLVSQPMEERPKILKARREARLAAQAQA